jgi:uncharacterized protein (DUF2141 family)
MKPIHKISILLLLLFVANVSIMLSNEKFSARKNKSVAVKKKNVKGIQRFDFEHKYFYGEKQKIVVKSYYLEDFESQNFPPSGWSISNPDSDVTWLLSTEASAFGVGTASTFINFYDYNTPEELDTFFMPMLTGLQNGDSLKFDVAYARYGQVSDSLFVLLSINGGNTFTRIYKKGGDSLKTAVSDDYFIPGPAQWRTEKIALPSTVANNNVLIAFVGYNDFGNNLFLDNIKIGKQPLADVSVASVRLQPEPYLINVPISVQTKLMWGGTGTPPQTIGLVYKVNAIPAFQNDGQFQNFNAFWIGNPPSATLTFIVPFTPNSIGDKTVYVRSFYAPDSTANNDVGFKKISVTKKITSFPYVDSFEDSLSVWSSGSFSLSNSWTRGKPNKELITKAYSGKKCWVTDTLGTYHELENSYVLSPLFDFSSESEIPILSFFHNYQTDGGFDGAVLEYSLDGINYSTLGSFNHSTAVHWYDVEDSVAYIGNGNWGYSSSDYDNEDSGWVQSSFQLDDLLLQPNVRFRFRLGSDESETDEGWAIDDFRITFSSMVTGNVFNDKNGNTHRDSNEVGIANWKVYRFGPHFNADREYDVDSTLTDSSGNYAFQNLLPGIVTLQEEESDNWIQTFPPLNEYNERIHVVRMFGNDTLKGKNFGNVRLSHISGMKFHDVNANGIKDSNENALSGWKIILRKISADTVITDSSGIFYFDNLRPGEYRLSEIPQDGWIQTVPPTKEYVIQISIGQNRENMLFGNTEASSISGMKWNDENFNGVRDSNEIGIEHWKFVVAGAANDTVETNADGIYTFKNLASGVYLISEIKNDGWIQSYPGGAETYEIDLPNKTDTSGFDFGNFQLATISGTLYEDRNQDGVLDSTESTPVKNIRVVLSGTMSDTVFSDSAGRYLFYGLESGTYTITLFVSDEWEITYPSSGNYTLQLSSGQHSEGNFFGLFHYGTVSGKIFHDLNANAQLENNEPFLSSWQVTIVGAKNDSAFSDSNGYFYFEHLNAGSYTLKVLQPNNWYHSLPTSGLYVLSIKSGSVIEGKNFGNFKKGNITGNIFHDINGNGNRDTNDAPLFGWKIKISGTASDSTFTDANGQYEFFGLRPGNYIVSEFVKIGWQQTFPTGNGEHHIALASGDTAKNKNFGNALPCQLFGYSFVDYNANGVRDSGDNGIPQRIIRLSGTATYTLLTNQSGKFQFINLLPGQYFLKQEQEDEWIQTFPPTPPGLYSLNLLSGTIDSGKDFGNFKYGRIYGWKFNDANGNGIKDSNENNLANWKIILQGPRNDSLLTNDDGFYEFHWLLYGTYTVSERQQSGWRQTFPPMPGIHSVIITSGKESEHLFGNRLMTGNFATETLPQKFEMYQNFPNPFNPTTYIQFDVPKTAYVSLFVFDILGQKIATVIEKNFSAGTHRVEFDASALQSGIYFYRMTINNGEFVQTKKLILMK